MKKIVCVLLALAMALMFACKTAGPAVTPAPGEEKVYVYPGEERQMAYRNPAYENAAFAEGAPYTPTIIGDGLKERFAYTGTVHWVDCHNNHVFTVLSLPDGYDGTQRYPLVLMLHGFNSTLDEWTYYVKPLNDAGYACLMFDFRGGHSGAASRSDGKMTQMSFDTKLADVRAVTAYAESLDCIDPSRMILAGHSQGGMMAVVTMCDQDLSAVFSGVLLLAPYAEGDIIADYAAPEDVPDEATLLLCKVGKDYLYAAWKYEHLIWDALPAYDRPVLLLTGEADEIVKVENVRHIADTIGDNAAMHVIPEGYHDFQPEIVTEVTETLILPFFTDLVS